MPNRFWHDESLCRSDGNYTYRPPIFALECDSPVDGDAPSVAYLYLFNQVTSLDQGLMRLVRIASHGILIRERSNEGIRVLRLDLPKEQPPGNKELIMSECSIIRHAHSLQ